jgi:dCMP deaminase
MKSSLINTYLRIAKEMATESKAKRLKVGAVIIRDGRSIMSGYNGCVAGGSNTCEYEVDGKLVTVPELIHAEENAILWCARKGVATENTTMICTHSPCFECAKSIAQCGIKELYYETEYRITDGIDYLRINNIKVEKIS